MNMSQELIDVLKNLSKKEVDYFRGIVESISEDEDYLAEVDEYTTKIELDHNMDWEELGKLVLYYIGFKHGMEDGVRLEREHGGISKGEEK